MRSGGADKDSGRIVRGVGVSATLSRRCGGGFQSDLTRSLARSAMVSVAAHNTGGDNTQSIESPRKKRARGAPGRVALELEG